MAFHEPDSQPQFPPDRYVRRDPEPTPPPLPKPPAPEPAHMGPYSGSPMKPKVKLADTSGDGIPAGASHHPPIPAPLPDRGAGLFFFINLAAAGIAVIFTFLIFLKL